MEDFAAQKSRLGRADLDDLSRPHALRAAAEQPGPDRAPPAQHSGRHRPDVDADRARPLLPHADRGDQDRVCRSQPVHRRSGVREDAGEGAAVEGLRRPPARAHRSGQGDRPAGVRRHPHGQRHDLLHRRRQGPQRRVVHQQHLSTPSDPAIVAGETGIMLQNRGAGFSLEPGIPTASNPASGRFTR